MVTLEIGIPSIAAIAIPAYKPPYSWIYTDLQTMCMVAIAQSGASPYYPDCDQS